MAVRLHSHDRVAELYVGSREIRDGRAWLRQLQPVAAGGTGVRLHGEMRHRGGPRGREATGTREAVPARRHGQDVLRPPRAAREVGGRTHVLFDALAGREPPDGPERHLGALRRSRSGTATAALSGRPLSPYRFDRSHAGARDAARSRRGDGPGHRGDDPRPRATAAAWLGSVANGIVRHARQPVLLSALARMRNRTWRCGADLIALAAHGRSPVGRALLGSVADKIVRGSRTAVLLVRPHEG